MNWKFSSENHIFTTKEKDGVSYLSINAFDKYNFVSSGFSTRRGGVSTGEFSTMNLSFARGDEHLKVYENFQRITYALDCKPGDIIFSKQTHTNKVVRVDNSHKGRIEEFYQECLVNEDLRTDHSTTRLNKIYALEEVDGMITNEPGLCLFTTYADCVPLYFLDPVKKAIGLSHSGWRGTLSKIGKVTVEAMTKEFGSKPEDIIVAIGPCICKECYEVSEDVIFEFTQKWDKEIISNFVERKDNGKYLLDLRRANVEIFKEVGILSKNIKVTNLCTACNHELLFSHRISQGKRGNLGALFMIKGDI